MFLKSLRYKTIVTILLGIFLMNVAVAQFNNFWAFGDSLGLDFSNKKQVKWFKSGVSKFYPDYKKIDPDYSLPCHSTMSDCNGRLLFYTNSQHIYNANGSIVKNSKLDSSNFEKFLDNAHWSTNVMILPIPEKKNYYLLIYSHYNENEPFKSVKYAKLHYDIKDSTIVLDFKDKTFNEKIGFSSNLTYIKHADNKRIWILISANKDSLFSYLLDSSGINSPPVVNKVFSFVPNYVNLKTVPSASISGMIKPSNSGNFLYSCGWDKPDGKSNFLYRYNFNRKTGIVSGIQNLFKISLPLKVPNYLYLIDNFEVSPNDSFVYMGFHNAYAGINPLMFQLNAKNGSLRKMTEFTLDTSYSTFGMNVGGDGKLYVFLSPQIFRINNPNEYNCEIEVVKKYTNILSNEFNANNYRRIIQNAFSLSNRIFLQSRSDIQENCIDTSIFYFSGDTLANKLVWKFGDGDSIVQKSPISWNLPIKHKYLKSGSFPIELHAFFSECNLHKVVYDTLNVRLKPKIQKYQTRHIKGCHSDTISWQIRIEQVDSIYLIVNGKKQNQFAPNLFGEINFEFIANDTNPLNIQLLFFNKQGCRIFKKDTLYPQFLPQKLPNWLLNQKSITQNKNVEFEGCLPFQLNMQETNVDSFKARLWYTLDSIQNFTGDKLNFYLKSAKNQSIQWFLESENVYGCKYIDSFKLKLYSKFEMQLYPNWTKECIKYNHFVLFNSNFQKTDSLLINWGDGNKNVFDSPKLMHQYKDTGSYELIINGRNLNGCMDTFNLNITIHPNNEINYQINQTEHCVNDNWLEFIPALNSQYYVNWDDNNFDSVNQNIVRHHYQKNGNFNPQIIIVSQNGCKDTFTELVKIDNVVKNNWVYTSVTSCIGQTIEFKPQTIFSNEEEMKLSKYFIYENKILIDSTHAMIANWNHKNTTVGKDSFLFVIIAPNGCKDSQQIEIDVFERPQIEFFIDPICVGSPIQIQSKRKNVLSQVKFAIEGQNFNLSLNPSETKWVISKTLQPGYYILAFESMTANGCIAEDTIPLVVNSNPEANISYFELEFNELGSRVQFSDTLKDAIKWNWKVEGAGYSNIQSPIFQLPINQYVNVTLSVENTHKCKDSIQERIMMIHFLKFSFPTVITNNSDQKNDFFNTTEQLWMKDIDVKIFNRWGEQVFKSNDLNFQWTSDYAGIYSYLIVIRDIGNQWHVLKGTVHVIK